MARKRVDKLLVDLGLAPTRNKARTMIEAGEVYFRGLPVPKVATLLSPDADLVIRQVNRSWVSRGAFKLLKGLDFFEVPVPGRVCLDVGASTGGFTEVLIDRGASKVYAVDVGYGQLAWSLRNDPRVMVMERTNARFLEADQFPEKPGLVVSDASFISLKLLVPAMERVALAQAEMILLIKPQFEAGRKRLGAGGVVRDPGVHVEILEEMGQFIAKETVFSLHGVTYSPIRGPKGNIEFLFYLTCDETPEANVDFGKVVTEAHRRTEAHPR